MTSKWERFYQSYSKGDAHSSLAMDNTSRSAQRCLRSWLLWWRRTRWPCMQGYPNVVFFLWPNLILCNTLQCTVQHRVAEEFCGICHMVLCCTLEIQWLICKRELDRSSQSTKIRSTSLAHAPFPLYVSARCWNLFRTHRSSMNWLRKTAVLVTRSHSSFLRAALLLESIV